MCFHWHSITVSNNWKKQFTIANSNTFFKVYKFLNQSQSFYFIGQRNVWTQYSAKYLCSYYAAWVTVMTTQTVKKLKCVQTALARTVLGLQLHHISTTAAIDVNTLVLYQVATVCLCYLVWKDVTATVMTHTTRPIIHCHWVLFPEPQAALQE